MNRKLPYDRGLILIVFALVGFGLVMVFSASLVVSEDLYGSSFNIFARQGIAAGIGLLLLAATMRIDYRFYRKEWVLYAGLAATLVMLVLALLGSGANGAKRWVDLGPMNFQPSELAKLMVILLTATFLVERGGKVQTLGRDSIRYMGTVALLVGLVFVEPDLGTAACMMVITGFLLFMGGLNFRYYLAAAVAAVPAFYFLVYQVSYRRVRILAFLDPWEDPLGQAYQIRQSLIAVGSGGWAGMGYAQGTQKLFFLPEMHSDFIYALIGQELGLLGSLVPLVLFGLFFWRGVRIALRADSLFGTYVGLGIVTMIVFQAYFNISVVLSLLPTKGIPLPFISAGGSSLMLMMAAVGILLNISRQARGRLPHRVWVEHGHDLEGA